MKIRKDTPYGVYYIKKDDHVILLEDTSYTWSDIDMAKSWLINNYDIKTFEQKNLASINLLNNEGNKITLSEFRGIPSDDRIYQVAASKKNLFTAQKDYSLALKNLKKTNPTNEQVGRLNSFFLNYSEKRIAEIGSLIDDIFAKSKSNPLLEKTKNIIEKELLYASSLNIDSKNKNSFIESIINKIKSKAIVNPEDIIDSFQRNL